MANEDRMPLTDWQRMQARREGYEAAHDVVQQLCRKLAEANAERWVWRSGAIRATGEVESRRLAGGVMTKDEAHREALAALEHAVQVAKGAGVLNAVAPFASRLIPPQALGIPNQLVDSALQRAREAIDRLAEQG